MNLIDFIKEYPDEQSCKRKSKEYRDQVGVSLETTFVDGTKIEANATAILLFWDRPFKNHKERISGQPEELWNYAEEITKEEFQNTESVDFKEIDSEKVTQTIEEIKEVLKDKKVSPKVQQKLNYAKKNQAINYK